MKEIEPCGHPAREAPVDDGLRRGPEQFASGGRSAESLDQLANGGDGLHGGPQKYSHSVILSTQKALRARRGFVWQDGGVKKPRRSSVPVEKEIPAPSGSSSYAQMLGWRLRLLRKAVDLDQKEFSRRIGAGNWPSRISNWERGRHKVPGEFMHKICLLTGATSDYLQMGDTRFMARALGDRIAEIEVKLLAELAVKEKRKSTRDR